MPRFVRRSGVRRLLVLLVPAVLALAPVGAAQEVGSGRHRLLNELHDGLESTRGPVDETPSRGT